MLISKYLPKDELLILGAHGRLRKVLNAQQSNYLTVHRARFQIKELEINCK